MKRFEGRVAVVAGGARGIGGRVAEDLVEQGGRVAIGDVNAELGKELAGKIGKDRAIFLQTDVTDPAQCANIIDAAWSEFGAVDYLVNSAISISGRVRCDLSWPISRLVPARRRRRTSGGSGRRHHRAFRLRFVASRSRRAI
jgi:short-subunit dehydrogenase